MTRVPFCFVAMPFRPELHYFYLYIQRHLTENHGLRVERGDHNVLTKAIMDKIRDQIVEADVIIGDITSANPNVLYEIGLAHAYGKPVIFLTQDEPASAPIDVRHFEFIQYDLRHHQEFLSKLDNAIQNVFVGNYRALYDAATDLLRQFNQSTGSSYGAATLEDFQARIMRSEHIQDVPSASEKDVFAEFLIPKILKEATDIRIMQKVMAWVSILAKQNS